MLGNLKSARNQDFADLTLRSKSQSNLPELTIDNEPNAMRSTSADQNENMKDQEKVKKAERTPEQIQMEKDERYMQAVLETRNMPQETAKIKLKEQFDQLHKLLKGKTPEEAVEAFVEFMEKNLSMIFELAKAAIGRFAANRPQDVLKKMFEEAVMGTGFSTTLSGFNNIDKHYWNRGTVKQDMGAIGYFDLCSGNGKSLFRAYYGKKEGY